MRNANGNHKTAEKFNITFNNASRSIPRGEIKRIIQNLDSSKKKYFNIIPSTTSTRHLTDLEFERVIEPRWTSNRCYLSGKCIRSCKKKAIQRGFGQNLIYLSENCDFCGRCVDVCPSGSWMAVRKGWAVWIGGKRGRYPLNSINVAEFVPDDEVPDIIERTYKWYRKNATKNERFGDTLREGGLTSLNHYIDNVFI